MKDPLNEATRTEFFSSLKGEKTKKTKMKK